MPDNYVRYRQTVLRYAPKPPAKPQPVAYRGKDKVPAPPAKPAPPPQPQPVRYQGYMTASQAQQVTNNPNQPGYYVRAMAQQPPTRFEQQRQDNVNSYQQFLANKAAPLNEQLRFEQMRQAQANSYQRYMAQQAQWRKPNYEGATFDDPYWRLHAYSHWTQAPDDYRYGLQQPTLAYRTNLYNHLQASNLDTGRTDQLGEPNAYQAYLRQNMLGSYVRFRYEPKPKPEKRYESVHLERKPAVPVNYQKTLPLPEPGPASAGGDYGYDYGGGGGYSGSSYPGYSPQANASRRGYTNTRYNQRPDVPGWLGQLINWNIGG